jgi:hypothetical protein
MAFMLSGVTREDQDVVEVDEDVDIEKVSEEVVHPLLERCRGIGETKGHDKAFEEPIAGPESGLPLVSRSNSKKIVCSTKVEFGEDLGTAKTIKSLADQRDGVPILDGNPVETPIIDAETKRTILLLDEEDRRASRRLGSSNKPLGEVVFKPFRQGLQLRLGQRVNRAEGWGLAGLELDRMITIRAMWGKSIRLGLGEGWKKVVILWRDDLLELLDVVGRIGETGRELREVPNWR